MKHLLVLGVMGLFILGCKQPEIQESYTNGNVIDGLEDGNWVYTSKDGSGDTVKIGKYAMGLKQGKWKYLFDDSTRVVNWNVYQSDSFKIRLSYPSYFNLKEQSQYPFFATLNREEYFVILYVPSNLGFDTPTQYVREVYKTMRADSVETFVGYTIHKVDFEKRGEVYKGELFIKKEDIELVDFVCYLKDDSGNIIDITFKTKKENLRAKQIIFNDLVYGIFSDNKKLFYLDDYVISSTMVNLD